MANDSWVVKELKDHVSNKLHLHEKYMEEELRIVNVKLDRAEHFVAGTFGFVMFFGVIMIFGFAYVLSSSEKILREASKPDSVKVVNGVLNK